MFKVNEASPGELDEAEAAEWAAFHEEALSRDAALSAGGPAIEWAAFEAWVTARLRDRATGVSAPSMRSA